MALRRWRKTMKAVEAVNVESDDEDDDENEAEEFTIADEDNIMTHMMECMQVLATMQNQERDIPANDADARMSRNKVFMAALSIVGGSC
jgi:hypothetical protein